LGFGGNGSKRKGGTKKLSMVCKKANEEGVIGGEGKGQRALGKKEVAELLSLHYSTVSRLGKAGEISRNKPL
jgi:hypothetical protein